MIRWIFAVVASVGLVGAGLVHGYWTDRWYSVRRRTLSRLHRIAAGTRPAPHMGRSD